MSLWSSQAHNALFSRVLNKTAAFGSDNPATARPETHQPLHTDKEQNHQTIPITTPAIAGDNQRNSLIPTFP
jgi:hypothetical protein